MWTNPLENPDQAHRFGNDWMLTVIFVCLFFFVLSMVNG